MIKRFIDLNIDEMKLVQLYLNRIDKNSKSISQIQVDFNTKVYNFGEGILFYFNDNKIIGSVKIVLEAIRYLSAGYIHDLTIDDNIDNEIDIVKELLMDGINILEDKSCNKILLGIRDEKVLKLLDKLGYAPSYNAYKMKLKNREIIRGTLELVNLTEKNKEEYLTIFNKSFSDMPHGCYYEIDDIEKYLKDTSGNKYYLVTDKNESIGFLNIEIENNIGSFDIGLCNEFRCRGYGEKLLETAISTLNKVKVEKVTLTVIEKNSVAFNMYLKRGFVVESILSYWIEIKNHTLSDRK
ncbi:MAG: GNAT family N-acetyltransferase [Sarcina sp.]